MEKQNIKNLEAKLRFLYPIWIVVAIFSVAYVPSVIFVPDDISSTATNLNEHEMLFRLGIIASFATAVLMVYISFYLYLLFESVNKNNARLMLILALISIPFMAFDIFKILSLDCETADCVYNYLSVSENIIIVASIFWGLWLWPLGKLVIESNYFPKFLGYILMAACWGYIVGTVLKIVYPSANYLIIAAEILTFGEVVFALWFVIRGLKLEDQ